ncbi:amino acid transporter [Angomonas deanei]|uniref:Transmembrane amino acid transporter protein, putative n=1 Tax=Angomonas deanei TaxID=59799 RepID=A0A7G2BZD0_9TRYP|nr:amino acid transporter [Angomonas deanei]CAD2212645.1 Transmembrane amino acid transporter protein, putative [Angomonas deanei]|eukprot:EPY30310.1 amino acid transporter [Angomonas deanei]
MDSEAVPEIHSKQPGKITSCLDKLLPAGGAFSNVVTLTAVSLGSGVMAIPLSFQQTGVITSLLINTAIAFFTVYSVYILMCTVDKTRAVTYRSKPLPAPSLGPGWDYLAAFNMFIFGFGSCVFFVISVGSLLLTATDDPASTVPETEWVTGLWSLCLGCHYVPLSLPKEINSLRYASLLSCLFIGYLVVMVIIHCCMNALGPNKPEHKIDMFKSGNDPIVGFSMVLFSYLCHIDTFGLYTEMTIPSPARMSRDTAVAMAITEIMYILCGVFAYLEFGENMPSYILLTYNIRESPLISVGYALVGLAMCFIFPLVLQPARDSLYYCLSFHFDSFRNIKTVPMWIHLIICAVMSLVSMIMGIFIPKDNVWFSLVGCFCTGFIGFIFPALFIMYAGDWNRKQVGWFNYVTTYLTLIAGVASLVFGCGAVLYLEVTG